MLDRVAEILHKLDCETEIENEGIVDNRHPARASDPPEGSPVPGWQPMKVDGPS